MATTRLVFAQSTGKDTLAKLMLKITQHGWKQESIAVEIQGASSTCS